jgi:transposase
MVESTPIVAFDQHAASVVAAVLLPGQRTPALHALGADLGTISRFVERLQLADVRCCYEAGPCGFELQRHLHGRGIACDVIAPALIPRRAGNRVKTDRRDAAQLAVLFRAGALTAIHVPTEAEEAVRDLLRCREDINADLLRAKHRLSKFLLRHGRRCPDARPWSKRFFAWLAIQRWPLPALEQTFVSYRRAIDDVIARRRGVDEDLRAALTMEPLASRVARLRCFRGIDDLSALTIAAELGDPARFAAARQVMAFTGLVPSEYSSGASRRRGGITKTGNAHLRRILVEAAWHYRHRPAVGSHLRIRQRRASPAAIRCAWMAQHRLHARYRRLVARGKSPQLAATAIARELSAFVWSALTH